MIMDIYASHIKWDTDNNAEALSYLPKEIKIPNNIAEEGLDGIGDYLSNETGFLHAGYSLENRDNTKLYLLHFSSDIKRIIEVDNNIDLFDYEDNLCDIDEVQKICKEYDCDVYIEKEIPLSDYIEYYINDDMNDNIKSIHKVIYENDLYSEIDR